MRKPPKASAVTPAAARIHAVRSRSVIADHLHADAVTEITFTTPSPGFSGFPSWGKWPADRSGSSYHGNFPGAIMKKLSLVPIVLGVFAFAGCSNQAPLAPAAAASAGELSAKPSAATPGVYTLTFMASVDGTLQDVTSLPVQTAELILKASVTSSTGGAAQTGTVTFEYCSYKGGPPNDITRADEAPKEACEQGTASWSRLRSLYASSECPALEPEPGYACLGFGVVRLPRVVGFRFRYASQGSGIASGTSQPENFTWTAGS